MALSPTPTPEYHVADDAWKWTAKGEPRGYIQPARLSELWFHTGTACNLRCPFCLEGSHPGDHRLQQMTVDDVTPFLEEALGLGVERFSFTGGEPFVNRDLVRILHAALQHRPCLVLTNGTKPLRSRMKELTALQQLPHPLKFRISIDSPDAVRHDTARGEGNFVLALETLGRLFHEGFQISIARLAEKEEVRDTVDAQYLAPCHEAGVPEDTHIVVFPDFHGPGAHPVGVPEITEHCMTTYHTAETRARFMCGYSKMVVKREGKMRVYACTLVDDDPEYDLGATLTDAMRYRVMLRHHRCFSCFARGASCSEG